MKKKKKEKNSCSPAVTNFPSAISKKSSLTPQEKVHMIAEHFQEIMEILGLDLTDNSLTKTPYRVAKMYVEEIFSGLDEANFPSMSFFTDDIDYDHNMVFVKVSFTSYCEHHFVPMIGYAYVAYLPEKKFIGLSKIPSIVHFFAARPQVQERLTAQIADSLALLLETENVAVSIYARHHCAMVHGMHDNNMMITNVLRGDFHTNGDLKREFLEAINRQYSN